jgi:hypothetical protein
MITEKKPLSINKEKEKLIWFLWGKSNEASGGKANPPLI